jgi:hypothetical protein
MNPPAFDLQPSLEERTNRGRKQPMLGLMDSRFQ